MIDFEIGDKVRLSNPFYYGRNKQGWPGRVLNPSYCGKVLVRWSGGHHPDYPIGTDGLVYRPDIELVAHADVGDAPDLPGDSRKRGLIE